MTRGSPVMSRSSDSSSIVLPQGRTPSRPAESPPSPATPRQERLAADPRFALSDPAFEDKTSAAFIYHALDVRSDFESRMLTAWLLLAAPAIAAILLWG